jgi:hypothetical protein
LRAKENPFWRMPLKPASAGGRKSAGTGSFVNSLEIFSEGAARRRRNYADDGHPALPLAAVAAGLTLLAADLTAAAGLGHPSTPFQLHTICL